MEEQKLWIEVKGEGNLTEAEQIANNEWYEVTRSCTVSKLLQLVSTRLNKDVKTLRLVFAGKCLHGNMILDTFAKKTDQALRLHLTLETKGGGTPI